MVPKVFEPLKFYCNYTVKVSVEASVLYGYIMHTFSKVLLKCLPQISVVRIQIQLIPIEKTAADIQGCPYSHIMIYAILLASFLYFCSKSQCILFLFASLYNFLAISLK